MCAWFRKQQSTKAAGDRLEKRVQRLYQRLGKWNVKRDVSLIDGFGNRSQIDVRYGLFFRKYIECKNYTSPVHLEEVAKFKEVLTLNKIPISRGIFITTSTYVPRARTIGIKTIDGVELRMLERRSRQFSRGRILVYPLILGGIGYYTYVNWDSIHWKDFQDKKFWKKEFYKLKKEFYKLKKRIHFICKQMEIENKTV